MLRMSGKQVFTHHNGNINCYATSETSLMISKKDCKSSPLSLNLSGIDESYGGPKTCLRVVCTFMFVAAPFKRAQ